MRARRESTNAVSALSVGFAASAVRPPKGNKAGYVEVVTWAVASGAAAAVAKRFAEDRAAQYWLKSTGSLPPGYEKEDSLTKALDTP